MEYGVAYNLVSVHLGDLAKNFYSSGEKLSPGAGLVYRNVPFPLFDDDVGVFLTRSGLVYILTHECDIDPENDRPFNDGVLVCPIIDLRKFVDAYRADMGSHELGQFLGNVGSRRINRVVFLPCIPDELPFGGLLYLNAITGTLASTLDDGKAGPVCAATARGLHYVDQMIANHLLRPKAERLALGPFRD